MLSPTHDYADLHASTRGAQQTPISHTPPLPPSSSSPRIPPVTQVLDSSLVSAGLDQAFTQWGQTINVVVNCAGIAVAQRVLGKKGPHSLEAFLKVSMVVVAKKGGAG